MIKRKIELNGEYTCGRYASTRMMTKILVALEYEGSLKRSEMTSILNTNACRIDDAIQWLLGRGLIERTLDNGIKIYRLKTCPDSGQVKNKGGEHEKDKYKDNH